MRLIDADAYKENHKKIIDCDICHPLYGDTLRELIDRAPTVEAMPVVHGHWVSINADESGYASLYRCSVCKREISLGYFDTDCDHEYCLHCGARMDETNELLQKTQQVKAGEQDATED